MVTLPKTEAQSLTNCPRCDTRLLMGYDEPQCPLCGFVDYSYAPISVIPELKGLLSSGTKTVVRYIGDSPGLKEVTTVVRAVREGNRLTHQVNCPFCPDGKLMTQSSLSGKRREVREERFRCEESHRLSLTPKRNGHLAWK